MTEEQFAAQVDKLIALGREGGLSNADMIVLAGQKIATRSATFDFTHTLQGIRTRTEALHQPRG